jgi:hypothetical protein
VKKMSDDNFLDDEIQIDYSTILSDNTNLTFKEDGSDQKTIWPKPDTDRPSGGEVKAADLIQSLNDEFAHLGFKSIIISSSDDNEHLLLERQKVKFNENCLIENCVHLAKLHRRTLNELKDVQNEKYTLARENAFLLKRDLSSKENASDLVRNVQLLEEKHKFTQTKVDEANRRVKLVEEENKKLSGQLEQREKLFKVEKIKQEKLINSLKDRIQCLTSQKSIQFTCLNLAEPLSKGHSQASTTTDDDASSDEISRLKKKMELTSELVKDYDRKRNELVIENNDLKLFLLKIVSSLDAIGKKLKANSSARKALNETESKENDNDDDDIEIDFESLLFNFEFEVIYKKLDSLIQSNFNLINIFLK